MSERKSFVFSPDANERLESLRQACRLSTGSNVIRLALMVLDDLIKAVQSGKTIVFVDKDGKGRNYHPLLEGGEDELNLDLKYATRERS